LTRRSGFPTNLQGATTTGFYNAAFGGFALTNNTTGAANVAIGDGALPNNNTGHDNAATGFQSLLSNTTGYFNTATGQQSLYSNTIGNYNTAVGTIALTNNVSGSFNTAIGYYAGTSAGAFNNTISIGNSTYLNGASNQAFLGGTSTVWNGGNVTWSTFSDARVKTNISEDVKGLEFINRLHPVTYFRSIKAMAQVTGDKEAEDYPEKYDIEKIKFSGFLAQEVEQAAKESGYDFNGITVPKKSNQLYSLSYEVFVVPLVKAVQEQQKIIEEQNKKIDMLLKELQKIKDKLK